MITARFSVLLVAAALAGVAVGVPAAGAGSSDVQQALRLAAVNYKVALLNGSPTACQMATPFIQTSLVDDAWGDAHKRVTTCPVAVKTLATFYASQFPSRAAYVRAGQAVVNAISVGKVKLTGSRATIHYVAAGMPSSIDLLLTNGRWLVNGWVELEIAP